MSVKRIITICLMIMLLPMKTLAQDGKSAEDFYAEVLAEENKTGTNLYITRSEFVSLLMKKLGYTRDIYICSFYDIRDADWNYTYIANAEHRQIALGNPEGGFMPGAMLTVSEAITFVSRAYKVNSYFGTEHNMGEILSDECPDYSIDYIKYAVANGLYPEENGAAISPKAPIKAEQAIKLVSEYEKKAGKGDENISFVYGYPKLSETGRESSVSVKIKTNKPCRIYAKAMLSEKTNSAYIPERTELTDLLTEIKSANEEITVEIPVGEKKEYNIYLYAVDEKGAVSRVHSIMNAAPLPFSEGSGTPGDPYRIYTKYQLEHIRNYTDKCFLLCDNIEYNGVWTPIGISLEQDDMFSGVFDGGGHSITGITVNGGEYGGIFAALNGGSVKNLSVSANVSSESYAGIIAGESKGGTIENCTVTGIVSADKNIAGGIAGKNDGVIKNCLSAAYAVTSTAYSGGISGYNSGTVSDCISAVTSVYSDLYSSSVSGINIGGTIKNCVGASIEAEDTLTKNSGRISTNRDGGICENNYVYDEMLSGSEIYRDKNGQDGDEISWEDMTSYGFYEKTLKWSFGRTWVFDECFALPIPKAAGKPKIQEGITVYAPKAISNEQELISIQNNLSGHYYLKNDITLTASNSWNPIGLTSGSADYENGFRGTLDGKGHTVRNMKIEYSASVSQYGLFGTLYGASVRNLRVENAYIEGHSYVGILAGANYGTITSCTASGTIKAYQYDRETLAGGICAMNYTNIYSSKCTADITINALSATAGGITAQNEGFINGCSYDSRLSAITDRENSNAVLGGICGINYSGMIYNSFGGRAISSTAAVTYAGGIAGILNGGEIYKCSSYGNMTTAPENAVNSGVYAGGICGTANGGLIMNSLSQYSQSAKSQKSYIGGIVGYGEGASVQNVYTLGEISQKAVDYSQNDLIFAGGIAGKNTDGNISGAVVISPYIITDGYLGEVCAASEGGYVDNNYYLEKIFVSGNRAVDAVSGNAQSADNLLKADFYIAPVSDGGLLGWMGSGEGEPVWVYSEKLAYPLPVLYGVDNQNVFTLPRGIKK